MLSPCHASHPPFQANHTSWCCPLCHQPLKVDLVASDAQPGCQRLHSDDILICTGTDCHFTAYGNAVAKLIATRGANKPCKHCQGRSHTSDGQPCPKCEGRGYIPRTRATLDREKELATLACA